MYYLLSGGKFVYITQKPIAHFRPHLSKATKQLIDDLVQLEPSKRPASVVEVKTNLLEATWQLGQGTSGKAWLVTKYVLSIASLLMVITYILFDQIL